MGLGSWLRGYLRRLRDFQEWQSENPEAIERYVVKARRKDWWFFRWLGTGLVIVNMVQGNWGKVIFGIPFIYFMLRRERSFDTDVET